MSWRRTRFVGIALALLVAATACGPGNEDTAATAPTGQESAPGTVPGQQPSAAGTDGEDAASAGEPQSAPGTGTSAAGHYRVSLEPEHGQIPIGQLHGWIVEVTTIEGEPFAPKRLAFGGGMPQHQHGFVTQPRVTRVIGPGRLLVEGVKFHMAGDWQLRLEIVGPLGPDVAIFHVHVTP